MDNIPEELIREILSHNILTQRSAFFHLETLGEQTSGARNAHLLRVCKRWLRVGTPLLYTLLWLSKPAHATTVAELFRAHPHVGRAVRGLQLQGGFGRELVPLARLMPNIDAVCVHLEIAGKQSVTGITKALPLFNPATLYIGVTHYRDNAKKRAVWATLRACIAETWTTLRLVRFSDIHCERITHELADALAKSSAEELECDAMNMIRWLRDDPIKRIIAAPRLERVVCRGASDEETIRSILRARSFSQTEAKKFRFVHGWQDDEV
ncbi:hypothetical protein PsYK624_139300 [Phanerochaete sordida]|uniref:Uncharacterized protein n=1 Tax=Phanerochaete sordida TaxID=48140 RepID=A0A9P3GNZ4_9APHY|nr:hypothetical protein PsYK624_139300 [Phanerochaete sordida]